MIDIGIKGTDNPHRYEELIKIFLRPDEYRLRVLGVNNRGIDPSESAKTHRTFDLMYDVTADETAAKDEDRYAVARSMYEDLASMTGKRPGWGVLTGIRPVKLAGEIRDGLYGKVHDVKAYLEDRYLIHPGKSELTCEIMEYQSEVAGEAPDSSFSMYIGIPFCPTRCLYCSFTSNTADDSEMDRYVDALIREIDFCAKATAERGKYPESIYMGGGTPTALSCDQLERVLSHTRASFDLSRLREFTVEAGRPDTISDDKLRVLSDHGIDKISINPQSMKQETLDRIGREHSVEDTVLAFDRARKAGIGSINMDLIAGLPGESAKDFEDSISQILKLGPEKITLHTLAVKRASRLKEEDRDYSYRDEGRREEMLAFAHEKLRSEAYRPYYLYRQKYTSGNTENTGWCRNDDVGIYNIRIMDEHQTILALGAGGISKIYFPEENRLERVPNVSNYEIYIDRIDEMIERKAKYLWIC